MSRDGAGHVGFVAPDTAAKGNGDRIYVPHYPEYDRLRAVLPAWAGLPASAVTGMRSAIMELVGTPQSQVDWTDPDEWIGSRLSGEPREWARRTWEGSDHAVNPRHVTGCWALARHFGLLETDSDGRLSLTDRGRQFIDEPKGAVVREIDEHQGLGKLLAHIADSGGAAQGDLMEPWREYLASRSRLRSENVGRATLRDRLNNLLARHLIERTGRSYFVTPEGLEHLRCLIDGDDEDQQLRALLRAKKQRVREGIRDLLADMDPYAFEHLISSLLSAIGYEGVQVTSASNDKGVDVLATIDMGITSVREVVQVKRHASNIPRPDLDRLRGVLHRFDAVRGTIITTSGFSKGTREAAIEKGAAPITLIDGEKLIDLLMEHGIGVTKREFETWDLDPEAFSMEQEEGDDTGDGRAA